MSQYINLARFGRLLRKHTAEHWKTYLMSAAVLLGGMVLVLGFITYLNSGRLNQQMQGVFFTMFVLAAGSFFTSTVLGQYGAGRQAALALTLPASQLEKFGVAWLFSLPVFLVVFTIAFYLADWLVVNAMGVKDKTLVPLFSEPIYRVVRLYLVLHGLALWGSIFFQRLQPVRVAFLGFGLALLAGVLNYQVVARMLGGKLHQAFPFGAAVLDAGVVSVPDHQLQWLALVPLVLAALLWAAAYARLTEKQL
ncbi:hypothetical protein A0257_04555 [Hymenobacter psoromatis]|nr:hypothetical protein A0257_04555 [Hymenobacter psoromatis]